jgi:hypothetical protein
MNIGVDIGWTLKGVRAENDKDKTAPNSFRIIRDIISRGHEIFLISKCNSRQKEEVEKWLKEVDIFNQTGIKPENLYFCFERKDKSLFVKALDIDIMIDDRAEVMAYLPPNVITYLLCPEKDDYEKHEKMLRHTVVVKDWLEIERRLFI